MKSGIKIHAYNGPAVAKQGEKTKLSETYFAKTFNWLNWAV